MALEAGRTATREELLAQHPDLAADLAEYFAEQDRLDEMMAPLRPPSEEMRAGQPWRDRADSHGRIDRKAGESTTAGPAPARANDGSGGPQSTSGVLDSLSAMLNRVPRVLLRDTEPGPGRGPLVQPSSPEMPAPEDRPARLQLFGEIARGGMGVVLKGRDVDLGRDLAVKVLLEGATAMTPSCSPASSRRRRSAASSSTRASCQSMNWASSLTCGPTSP